MVAIAGALDKDVAVSRRIHDATDTWMRISSLFHFSLLLTAMFFMACGGCDESFDGTATVVLESIDPAVGYVGVDASFELLVTPGANTTAEGMTWQVDFGDGAQVSGDGVSGTARHAFERGGEYEVIVKAVFDSVEVGRTTVNYRVLSPVDLELDSIRGAPANLRTEEDITVSLVMHNNTATDVVAEFAVGVYLSTSASVTAEDVGDLPFLGNLAIQGTGPDDPVIVSGDERSAGITTMIPANVPSGDYFVVGLIDPDLQVGDTNRTNNLRVSAGIVRIDNVMDSIPDVTIANAVVIPDRAYPTLNTITRGFTVQNLSNVDAFGVVHRTYLSVGDNILDATDDLIFESDPFDVVGRGLVEINPTAIVLDNEITPPEMQELKVYVLIVLEVTDGAENNLDNNMAAFEILVTDQPVEGPDLAVKAFTVSPDRTFLNGTLEVSATIANEGTIDVGSFFCGIYLGANPRVNTQADPRLDNINIPALGSEESVVEERLIVVPGLYDPGTYYVYIVCDPQNALQEAFRSNNSYVYLSPIVITDEVDVDIYPESVVAPAQVTDGGTFDVAINVCVLGSNPSGATQGKIWLSPGLNVNYNATPTLTFDVPNVLPGECEEVIVTLDADCLDFVDRYTVGVELDSTKVLPENDETNNRKAASGSTTIQGDYCACVEDSYEPNDRSLDAKLIPPGPLSAAVCLAGTCDFFAVDVAQNDSLIVRNTFDGSKGRLTTTLFEPSGVQAIDNDTALDTQEVATFLVPQTGRYIFSVCGTGGTRNLYDLDVQVIPQAVGVDIVARDLSIPASTSYSVGANLDIGLRVYNVGQTTASPFEAAVVISSNQIVGDADDVPVTSIQVQSLAGGAFRDIVIPSVLPTSLTDGDYYIAVNLDPAGQLLEANRVNNFAVSRKISVVTQCYDPLEPNDSFAGAKTVTAGSFNNLVACTAAPDVYRLCLADGKKFTAKILFDPAAADIDMELFNEQFQLIGSSATSAGVEQVSRDYVNGSQCFYLRTVVIALPGQIVETSYTMDIDVQDVDPALLCASAFEPNDSFNTSSSLLAATSQAFSLDRCPSTDTDFFYVDLTASQRVSFTASLVPIAQQGTLRLQLYLPSRTPGPNIETAPGVPSASLADYLVPQTGRYFLQVTVSGSQRNVTYDLDVSGLAGVDLQPNNLAIGPGSYRANDEIRFGFVLANLGTTSVTTPGYELFYGTSATPNMASDISLGTYVAPTIAGNSSASVADRANVPGSAAAGQGYLHLVIDPAGTTGDVNTANNIMTIPITIVP